MKKTEEDFQRMIQERLRKVEEIKNCLKLSAVSRNGNVDSRLDKFAFVFAIRFVLIQQVIWSYNPAFC